MRVFISFTFCDMLDEREELAKQFFPQLRKFFELPKVTWSEVDLHGAINEEQKA